ncbi:CBS domain-containing protein [Halorussus caseinilyticus]|uniref:CBS domain-containing protein n=1 Tax=Halorussus caseinilyticus TaxID=3034025 RepID=A0ABD5WLP5_9EURY|nr:CBS domain-containing protein [Halorussus sp. DT72]
MLVRDAMTTDVVTAAADASVREAVGRMLRAGVGSVVVTREGNPAGILTETDALKAGYHAERPFGEIPVSKAATDSLVTTSPGTTIRGAVRQMRENDVKKLPVVDGMEIVGMLTMTDVVRAQENLVDEAVRLEERRQGWTSEGKSWGGDDD